MGKSKRKSLIVMLFAWMLMIGTLAGCSGKKEVDGSSSGDSTSEDISKVKVFKSHMGIGKLPGPDDPHVKKVLEATGVQYELMATPAGADPAEYLNLMFASEDYPDIFRPIGGFDQTLISQGAVLPLDDLLPKYAPHVWESIPKEAWDVVRSATPDGKIYYVPKVYLVPERAALIRQDWVEAVGMDMPKTVEEYKELLIAFRDKDPNGNGKQDELPTSGREFGKWMDHLFAMYGVAMWEGVPEWDIYEGKIQYAGVSKNMKAAISFIRELYKEKLLDNETFLNKGEVWTAKINTNLVGSWYHLPGNLRDRHNAMLEGAPDAYVAGMPLPKAEGFEGYITQKSMGEPEWMIPAASEENAEAALKLLDFFYDPANNELITYGIEGAQHKVENGKKVLLPPTDETPIALGMKNLVTKEDMDIRIEQTMEDYQKQMVKDIFKVSTSDARRIAGDGLPSTVYQGFPDIQSHKLFQEYLTKIVIGEWPIEKFDEFADRWNKAGGKEVTERVQDWYERVNE